MFTWPMAVMPPWGGSCRGIRVSADMFAGSGLRSGDANISTVAPYSQFNVGVAREFLLPDDPKLITVRFECWQYRRRPLLSAANSSGCTPAMAAASCIRAPRG